MTITLNTDTFCTVASADASRYLVSNENWTNKTTAQKENYLKSATKIINRLRFRGAMDVSTQALEMPRSMAYLNYPENYFTDAYMADRFAEATAAQVAYDLMPPRVSDLKGGIVMKDDKVCPAAMEILRPYIAHLSPTSPYDYEDPYDPLRE